MPGTPPYRLAGVLFQHPLLAAKLVYKLLRYVTSRKAPPEIFRSLLRGQVHTLGVGMHNFMDAKQVAQADTDPVIRARLDSCVFKGAVKRDGEWVAVPMCSMNQQTWSEVYDGRLNDPELLKQPQVFSRTRLRRSRSRNLSVAAVYDRRLRALDNPAVIDRRYKDRARNSSRGDRRDAGRRASTLPSSNPPGRCCPAGIRHFRSVLPHPRPHRAGRRFPNAPL